MITVLSNYAVDTDPRAQNCRAYAEVGGKTTGVELKVTSVANPLFKLASVELIDENMAKGETVATYHVFTKTGVETKAYPVLLMWPRSSYENKAAAGNQDNKHIITSEYWPPDFGYLAMAPFDTTTGKPVGDIVEYIGLPKKHHISFLMNWVDVSAIDSGGNGGGTGDCDLEPVMANLAVIENQLVVLSEHLGVK